MEAPELFLMTEDPPVNEPSGGNSALPLISPISKRWMQFEPRSYRKIMRPPEQRQAVRI